MRPAPLLCLLTLGCGDYSADAGPELGEEALGGAAPVDDQEDGSGGAEATGGSEDQGTGGVDSLGTGGELWGTGGDMGTGGDQAATGGAQVGTGGDEQTGSGGQVEMCAGSRRCTNGIGAGACYGRQWCNEDGLGWETHFPASPSGPVEHAVCHSDTGDYLCPSVGPHGCAFDVERCSDGLCATDYQSGACPN